MRVIDGKEYYNTKEVAERLDVSIWTVRRYIKWEKLSAKKIMNKYLISEENIKEFLA